MPMCCQVCHPDPLALHCLESGPDNTIAFYEPQSDMEVTPETLIREFKYGLLQKIQNDHLKKCFYFAYNLNETFSELLEDLSSDPAKELPHLFMQLKPHAVFDSKHQSCHGSAFDAISLNHILEKLGSKMFLLYSMDYLREYMNEVGSTKMSILNLARVYGGLIGMVAQEYLEVTKNEPVMTQEYVDYLNSIQSSWKAGLYPQFANMNRKQLSSVAGATFHRQLHGIKKPVSSPEIEMWDWPCWLSISGCKNDTKPGEKKNTTEEDLKENFPANFRVGENWPGCESGIKNQAKCDGCWAFSSVGIMNDRFCIVTGGKVKVDLSMQYILDCAVGASGCGGGNTDAAWRSFTLTGTPTYECIPFEGKFRACGQDRLCGDGSAKRQYYASANYSVGGRQDMKRELMKNGSIQAIFKLSQDFFAYTGGIYNTTAPFDQYTPEHAIRIVGWGIENGVEFWQIANSFGPGWGENGYVRFRIGDANIEAQTYAGTPDLKKSGITL
eukprot:CAMPEP_0176418416 /NCGR_PEP_ID=MMETSP0127-20121128/7452_1 /TAXON_ID=938130 /ORGANISM="Platyophrya macrostoma, Strain WH" /LENGTH=497 /DNA_ID=CAMNT_0017798725 /DNA_START=155 /DNA_END=1648 /DNA_ORIENTATION=-